jgi:hypothetical protein
MLPVQYAVPQSLNHVALAPRHTDQDTSPPPPNLSSQSVATHEWPLTLAPVLMQEVAGASVVLGHGKAGEAGSALSRCCRKGGVCGANGGGQVATHCSIAARSACSDIHLALCTQHGKGQTCTQQHIRSHRCHSVRNAVGRIHSLQATYILSWVVCTVDPQVCVC